jgi:NAD(P)-dependent dehydrogenase (short-subunit alcohol dehydrogenase family)
MDLKDKVCVITGAARGIGLALSSGLQGCGAKVAMLDVDETALRNAAKDFGADVLAVSCDITSGSEVAKAMEEVIRRWGAPDVWINNAGLARHRWIPDYTEEEIDLMLAVNLKGTILGSQAALQKMITRKSGSIVNIISTASLRGVPSETVYCAAKWGVRGFTQGLCEEAAAHNIRVIAVLPGGVDTAFWNDAATRKAPVEKFLTPQQVADAVIKALQMDDWCVPREIVLRSMADSDFSVKPA